MTQWIVKDGSDMYWSDDWWSTDQKDAVKFSSPEKARKSVPSCLWDRFKHRVVKLVPKATEQLVVQLYNGDYLGKHGMWVPEESKATIFNSKDDALLFQSMAAGTSHIRTVKEARKYAPTVLEVPGAKYSVRKDTFSDGSDTWIEIEQLYPKELGGSDAVCISLEDLSEVLDTIKKVAGC